MVKNVIKRIAVKVGTSSLTYKNGKINIGAIEKLVRLIADLKNRDIEVVLISSGAIGIGASKLGISGRPKTVMERQAAAAVGQCALMDLYDKLFSEYGYTIGQLLLTKDIADEESKRINAKNSFKTLLEYNVIPIVNENDAISTAEIGISNFGDNDALSAFVAVLSECDSLCIMTDRDGLYDSDPTKNENAKIIPVVYEINDETRSHCGISVSGVGTGGMITKVNAAEVATSAGVDVYFINSSKADELYNIVDGKEFVGTYFPKKD